MRSKGRLAFVLLSMIAAFGCSTSHKAKPYVIGPDGKPHCTLGTSYTALPPGPPPNC
jgi:hypothetical protein